MSNYLKLIKYKEIKISDVLPPNKLTIKIKEVDGDY